MMQDETAKLLHDALAATIETAQLIHDQTFDKYLSNRTLQLALERLLEIIGEALNQAIRRDNRVSDWVPDAVMAVGMRNRIVHGYDSINYDMVWDSVTMEVPLLQRRLQTLLHEAPPL